MLQNLFKDYIYPIAVFSGGMIGVGFLSLPYIAMRAGIWLMLLYFLIITALVLIINLIFCQISLKTPDFKRFPGFVGRYLGKWGGFFAMLATIFATFGISLVYLIIGGQFLATVFQPIFSGSALTYVLIYFLIVSIIIFFDIKVIARVEFWVIVFLFLSLLLLFFGGFSQINLSNIFVGDWQSQTQNFFLPYGALLFALWGTGLIPETEAMLRGRKRKLKTVVTISTIIISVFYLLFTLLILSISGKATSQVAIIGLERFMGGGFVSIALLAGALATITAFISQGIIFKKTLMFDLKIKHWQAFVITCFTPMVLFLIGIKSFIPLISFVGGVLLGIDGILILLMYKKIGGKNIVIYPLSLFFLLGVIYEIIYFIK